MNEATQTEASQTDQSHAIAAVLRASIRSCGAAEIFTHNLKRHLEHLRLVDRSGRWQTSILAPRGSELLPGALNPPMVVRASQPRIRGPLRGGGGAAAPHLAVQHDRKIPLLTEALRA